MSSALGVGMTTSKVFASFFFTLHLLFLCGGTLFIFPHSAQAQETWTSQESETTVRLRSVTFGNSLFVVGGTFGIILTSADGETWTSQTNPLSGLANFPWAVAFGGSKFVALGDKFLSSSNGVTWSSQTNPLSSSDWIWGVTFGGSARAQQFVAVANSGTILTSSDGDTWITRESGTTNSLFGVTFGGSARAQLFVAVGNAGTILTSSDGVTWNPSDSGITESINGVTFGGDQFVAVTGSSSLTSSDGLTWTSHTIARVLGSLFGVTFGASKYVAVGGEGTILTSSDGKNWTSQSNPLSGTTTFLEGVTLGGSARVQQFVAVASNGSILTSSVPTPTPTPTPEPIPALGSGGIVILVLLITLLLVGLVSRRRIPSQ